MSNLLASLGLYLLSLLVAYFFLTLITRGGCRTTKKTTFIDVGPKWLADCIQFNGVWMKRTIRGYSSVTVRVYPKELGFCPVEVGLDPEAEGTLISVTPTLVSRIFSPSLGCTAKSVIIWVCSQNDMRMWKEWINDAEENYFDEKHKQTSKPPATSITPK